MSHQKPWAESMTYLMQLPGFGVITGMTVLAANGDVQRFECARHLASYSGLTRQQFSRYYLIRLGIGHDLTRIALDPKRPRKLASEAELLALRPELNYLE